MRKLTIHIGAWLKQVMLGLLMVILLSASLFSAVPQPAEAQLVVNDPLNTIQGTLSATANSITAGVQSALQLKEFTLDGIAWSLAKKILAQTTRSIIDWINSGFNGKPAFITNLNNYLLNAADQVAGDFLSAANMGALCQPLQMPVRIIVNNYYARSRDWQTRSQCTLSGAVGNVDNFLSGNFSDGGWSKWFNVVSEPQNNIYGASALAIDGLRDSTQNARENAKTESIWNNGFMSVKNCSSGTCVTLTPGHAIAEMLNFQLTVGDRVLIQADQMNELIGALFDQLSTQAITGVGGLLGMSYSPNGTSPSYLNALSSESQQLSSVSSSFLDDALANETLYQAMYEKASTDLGVVIDKLSSSTCASAASAATAAETLQTTYDGEVTVSDSLIAALRLMKDQFTSTANEQLQLAVVTEFQRLQSSHVLHDPLKIDTTRQDIADNVVAQQIHATNVLASCDGN